MSNYGDHISPWHPITDAVDLKYLGKLVKESGELASITARVMIQGIDGINPDGGKVNRQALSEEIADVFANCLLVIQRFGLNTVEIDERKLVKMSKLRIWHAKA
jgi:hypothetical protein